MRKLKQEHIDAYKKGCFKKLFDVIKADPELSFEIRMNNEVMIYYRKDKILTTKYECSNGNVKRGIRILDSKYYKNSKQPTVSFGDGSLDYTLNHTSLLRRYFKEAKCLVHAYKMGMEFEIQQNIALGNHSFDKRYLVVDMEWQFPQSDIPANERISKTRIDLVVVDTEPDSNGENNIYLAELKVGTGATEGRSGIIDHVGRTKELTEKSEACKVLRDNVESVLLQKTELGLIDGAPRPLNLSQRPKMMLILAFRGQEEKKRLEEQAEDAKRKAQEQGMDAPRCIFHNALIELK